MVLFWADRYSCTVCDILQRSINNTTNSYVQFTTVDDHLWSANLLSDILNIRDGRDLLLANLLSVELTISFVLFVLPSTVVFIMSFHCFS